MKITNHILRILLGLLLLMPVAGTLGLMPEPTADMYTTTQAWDFISALANSGYMMPLIGVTAFICSILFFANKTALGAVILAPFTVNVIAFHLFLDASPISAGAIPAYILVALNLYFLWSNKAKYTAMM